MNPALARRSRLSDYGSGTVIAIALMSAIVVGLTAVVLTVGAYGARSQAQGVADLAALAAASQARDARALGQLGPAAVAEGCARAQEVARRHRASVTHCAVDVRGRVTVAVEVSRGPWNVERRSRAGTPGN